MANTLRVSPVKRYEAIAMLSCRVSWDTIGFPNCDSISSRGISNIIHLERSPATAGMLTKNKIAKMKNFLTIFTFILKLKLAKLFIFNMRKTNRIIT
jgi:hypothetical protein